MRVIIGLGNPGNKYKNNRHNSGFMLLDYFASEHSLSFSPSKGNYYYSRGILNSSEFYLVKPATFMNNSGIAAKELIENLKINIPDLLVIHDDINLDLGKIRVKLSGGDGGHNGITSIIYNLVSNEFTRLRIGVGNNFEKGEMADYVLSDFNSEERKILGKVFLTGNYLIEEFIKGGVKNILDASSLIPGNNKNSENTEKNNTR
ncbi:MAG: aminoacyl-tRNA hydrolase [Ignavibacteriaceae bacterium]